MRKLPGIAGATLIYGPRDQHPDLILALQFLLDDLRRDGRQIGGVRLSGQTLRLRADDFDLAVSVAPGPLPVAAFTGVLRPAQAGSAAGGWPHDLARGRLLHAIRHHHRAVGVLLRARCSPGPAAGEEDLDLGAECRTVVAALVEASPAQFILWQQSGVLFTLAEFRNLTPPRLNAPGDARTAFHPRPLPAVAIRRPNCAEAAARDDAVASGGGAALPRPARGDVVPGAPSRATADQRRRRLDRLHQRSAGRLFRRADDRRRADAQTPLERMQRRLARAFGRGGDRRAAPDPARPVPSRRIRLLSCALLALMLALLLPPWTGV